MMSRLSTVESKIIENEEKLMKLKERCNKVALELEKLYEEKTKLEDEVIIEAFHKSSRSKAELMAFLGIE